MATGVQPRPLRYRGRVNRRAVKMFRLWERRERAKQVEALRAAIAENERRFGGPRIYDPEFGSMPLHPTSAGGAR